MSLKILGKLAKKPTNQPTNKWQQNWFLVGKEEEACWDQSKPAFTSFFQTEEVTSQLLYLPNYFMSVIDGLTNGTKKDFF